MERVEECLLNQKYGGVAGETCQALTRQQAIWVRLNDEEFAAEFALSANANLNRLRSKE
jgi:hypothetical protein